MRIRIRTLRQYYVRTVLTSIEILPCRCIPTTIRTQMKTTQTNARRRVTRNSIIRTERHRRAHFNTTHAVGTVNAYARTGEALTKTGRLKLMVASRSGLPLRAGFATAVPRPSNAKPSLATVPVTHTVMAKICSSLFVSNSVRGSRTHVGAIAVHGYTGENLEEVRVKRLKNTKLST